MSRSNSARLMTLSAFTSAFPNICRMSRIVSTVSVPLQQNAPWQHVHISSVTISFWRPICWSGIRCLDFRFATDVYVVLISSTCFGNMLACVHYVLYYVFDMLLTGVHGADMIHMCYSHVTSLIDMCYMIRLYAFQLVNMCYRMRLYAFEIRFTCIVVVVVLSYVRRKLCSRFTARLQRFRDLIKKTTCFGWESPCSGMNDFYNSLRPNP